jgi:Flp pilus assembly protein TadD
MGQIEEARIAYLKALDRFPEDAVLLSEYGYFLIERGEHAAALERFERATANAPDRPEAVVGAAMALQRLLRFDEAETRLNTARERFSRLCFVWCAYANSAEARGDREETARRWREILQNFPGEPISYAGLGGALSKLQRHEEAEAILQQGLERFPEDVNLLANAAWAAVGRGDATVSRRRWAELVRRAPNDAALRSAASEAEMHVRLAEADAGAPVKRTPAYAGLPEDRDGARNLMGRFESLGENCELGFVQRHFGAEPLGVFRWAGISYGALIDALDRRLEGIGDSEQTEILLNPHNNEYYIQDKRYGMNMHTFILQGAAPADTVKAKMCRRLVYLREKLLEDFADSTKIFVFNTATPLSDEDLARLRRALDPYGPTPLLHVAPHLRMEPATVTAAGERTWRASLGKTGFDGKVWDIEFESWGAICATVARRWDVSGSRVVSAE